MIILKLGYNTEYMIPESMVPLIGSMIKVEQIGDQWIKHKTDVSVIFTEGEIIEDNHEAEVAKLKDSLKNMEGAKEYYERQAIELKKKVEDGQRPVVQ